MIGISGSEREIWAIVQALNRAWTVENDPDRLTEFFHPKMVAITPVDRLRRLGQSECMAGWKEFTKACRVLWWKEAEPAVEVFGDCAVVTYYFEMEYELEGRAIRSAGRDMMTLVREDDRWWVVADQFSPYP
jgi:ketosteroid isomerase-like protein